MVRSVVWRKKANETFEKFIKRIHLDSWSRGEQIRVEVLEMIGKLSKEPGHHPLDRFKLDNDGSFRAFEHKSLRISYRVTGSQIQILMARHTKMKPKYH